MYQEITDNVNCISINQKMKSAQDLKTGSIIQKVKFTHPKTAPETFPRRSYRGIGSWDPSSRSCCAP